MCELLNRIWSRPRGEWTRVLRKELPTIADQVVEALHHSTPQFSALVAEMDNEDVHFAVEQALLTALGYQKETDGEDRFAETVPAPVPIDRARRHLFAALSSEPGESEASLNELARAARWPLPETVRVVVLAAPAEAHQLAAALGDTLFSVTDNEPCLVVPDQGAATRTALEGVLRGRRAAIGHPVPISDAVSSLRWARRLFALMPALTPPRGGTEVQLAYVDDHLSMLLLLQDESLSRALTSRWLQPLEMLTPRQSERLEGTLLAWLEGGGAPEAARTLQVHPQTVRYRLRQIEKLFGPALRDPRTRFELEMTLRARRLTAQVRRRNSRAGRRTRTAASGIRPLGGGSRQARVNGL